MLSWFSWNRQHNFCHFNFTVKVTNSLLRARRGKNMATNLSFRWDDFSQCWNLGPTDSCQWWNQNPFPFNVIESEMRKLQAKHIRTQSNSIKWYSRFFSFFRPDFCFMYWISIALSVDFLVLIIEFAACIRFTGFWNHANFVSVPLPWWIDTHQISFSYCFALALKKKPSEISLR